MRSQIVNGEEWIRRRLDILRGALDDDLTDAQRAAIHAEIDRLTSAAAVSCHGIPVGWFRRLQARRSRARGTNT